MTDHAPSPAGEPSRRPLPGIPDHPRPAEYQRIARQLTESPPEGLQPLRVAMLAGSTMEFLRPVLVVEAARAGFALSLYLGDFGQMEQPVLDPGSPLYAFDPDVLVLHFQPEDVVPDFIARYHAADGARLGVGDELIERLIAAAGTFRDRTGRPAFVANFATPHDLPLGPFDAGDPRGVTHYLAAKNAKLAERLYGEADLYVWDYAGLVRSSGSRDWRDPRLAMLARVPVAADGQPAMARHLVRTVSAVRRRPAKCLVLDLDNTLWGGVVGDDGPEGLQLGDDWPGTPYKAFQRTVLGLRDRGILLAVSSKNDEPVAADVFHSHPEMLIRWDDLAAVRINWGPKSEGIRQIAAELNIGTDALVLFDDNPVERAEVRAALPEVGVIEVPPDPTRYSEALLHSGFFDQLALSDEDRERAEMYRVERSRTLLRERSRSVAEFLESLEMVAEVGTAGPETLGRIAQLVSKTNQFNLTTRRHAPAELAAMAGDEDKVVAWLRLADRFGDQGLIAVGILERRDDEAWIDTFLMSCRVMNRGVEQAFMAQLAEHARALGCAALIGEYRPTKKNHMVEGFYREMGFDPHGESDGGTLWRLDLRARAPEWPAHIRGGVRSVRPQSPTRMVAQ